MITKDNSVLAVVDMQNGFVSSKSRPIVEPVIEFVKSWKAAGLPYFMTRFINPVGSPYERLINWTRLRESPEIDLEPGIAELASDAVTTMDKPTYSLFTDQGEALIRSHGWTNLFIVGIATESCVLKSAADAFESGITPWIVKDAVYSHAGAEAHEAGLLVAGRFIGRGQLVTTTEALASVVGGSMTTRTGRYR